MSDKKTSSKSSNSTKVIRCTCNHGFQNSRYGTGMRLMNNAPSKGAQPNRYRCTVCGKETNG